MEIIDGITFDEKEIDLSRLPTLDIENFLKVEKIKEILNSNNFDDFFYFWRNNNKGFLCRPLIILLLSCDISFLKYMTFIPSQFFENCDFIQKIELPKNITSIGNYAFENAYIEELKIPKDAKINIHSNAFTRGVKKIIYEGTREEWEKEHIGYYDTIIYCSDGKIEY